MKGSKELYQALRAISKAEDQVLPGLVTTVETDTIDVDVAGVVYYGVRLKSVADGTGTGLVIKPKVGSVVLISKIGDQGNEFFVSMYSEVDTMHFKNAAVEMKVDDTGFLIKKGSDTLLQVLKMIIESQQQIMVLYGNNPDYVKLAQATVKLENLFN
jgi:hypothetical protein